MDTIPTDLFLLGYPEAIRRLPAADRAARVFDVGWDADRPEATS